MGIREGEHLQDVGGPELDRPRLNPSVSKAGQGLLRAPPRTGAGRTLPASGRNGRRVLRGDHCKLTDTTAAVTPGIESEHVQALLGHKGTRLEALPGAHVNEEQTAKIAEPEFPE